MVARCKKVIAVDFDGTLLRGNSLRLYLRAGVAELLRRGAFGRLARTAWISGLRLLRLVSHERLKFSLQALIGRDDPVIQRYRALARGRLNAGVLELIKKSGADPVVVSAAFGFCIEGVVPFPVLASPPVGPELRGEAKAERLRLYLEEQEARLEAVVTDSADDLPLLLMPCTRRYLVAPSRRDLRILRRACGDRPLDCLDKKWGLKRCLSEE